MTDHDLRALERKLAQDPGDLVTARALYRGRLQIAPDRCPKCYGAGAACPLPGSSPATCCCTTCYGYRGGDRLAVDGWVGFQGAMCLDCPRLPT